MTNLLSVSAKSATRVDLAGGTLDLWPLSALIKGACTVNASINCYTEVSFFKSNRLEVDVESPDFKESFKLENLDELMKSTDGKLSLLKEAFSVFDDASLGYGKWVIRSESPAGSGLGGSSSLLISILKVIYQIESRTYTETSIINTAKNIESRVLNGPAGIQDYFSPVKEGLNLIHYKEEGFVREILVDLLSHWKDSFTIVDSEIKHHSGMNNWEILKSFVDGDVKTVEALRDIAKISMEVLSSLKGRDISNLVKAFNKELEARKKVSSSYINEDLEQFLEKLSSLDEVQALKVCGAGGGGCVLVLHKPEDKEGLHKNLLAKGVSVLPFELTGSK